MSNSTVLSIDRSTSPRRFRAPIAAAGAAVLGLSLLLSVAPAFGAANNGNGNSGGNGVGNSSSTAGNGTSGNVKVHDAETGVETSGGDNEPHVCAFWLGFTFDAPFESGTWVVVSWPPTGIGSTVASGVYNTAGDGIDNSNIIEVAAGHYRVEWAATGATSSKKKTFWVDAECDEPAPPAEESQAEESQVEDPAPPTDAPGSPAESQTEESQAEDPAPPTDAPGSPAEESQAEESQAEDPAPPTDAPGSPAEESQAEELVLGGQETAPEDEESQAEEVSPTDEEDAPPAEDPADEDVTAPDDEVTPPADASGDEEAAQAEDPGSTDPGQPPAEDELGSTGGADEPTMPDTATPELPVQSGLLATLGLLMLIVVHATARRERRSDRENAGTRA